MYRQCINFYINRNNNLACIWYAQRQRKLVTYHNTYDDAIVTDYEPITLADRQYAVRNVLPSYNCDKYGIGRVGYVDTKEHALDVIKRAVHRNKPVDEHTLTSRHLLQLATAPTKYVKWFFSWLQKRLSEAEYQRVLDSFYKVASKVAA